jgi:hypothetical protein
MSSKTFISLILIYTFSYSSATLLEFDIDIKHSLPNIESSNNIIYLDEQIPAFDLFRSNIHYLIKFNIGSPAQTFELMLDTGSFVTWVAYQKADGKIRDRTKYNPGISKYYSKESDKMKRLMYASYNVFGTIFNDVISFNNNPGSGPMKLLAAEFANSEVEMDFDGFLGLGRVFNNEIVEFCNPDYSVINNLYNQKLINKRVFSFQPVDEKKGKFYIGDYHPDFAKDNAKCNVYNGQAKSMWTCQLAYIITGEVTKETFLNKAYEQNKEIIIDSGSEATVAPESAAAYFKNGFLKDLLSSKACQEEILQNQPFITCPEDLNINDLPQVYFVLNGFALKVSGKHLFIKNNPHFKGKLLFGIIFAKGLDFWLIGQQLFYENHILFDHDNNVVAFAGEIKNFTEFTTDSGFHFNDYIVAFVVGLIVLVVLIIIAVICIIRKKRLAALQRQGMNANLI